MTGPAHILEGPPKKYVYLNILDLVYLYSGPKGGVAVVRRRGGHSEPSGYDSKNRTFWFEGISCKFFGIYANFG